MSLSTRPSLTSDARSGQPRAFDIIEAVLRESIGITDRPSPHDRIDEFLTERLGELDLDFLSEPLATDFGISLSQDDWDFLSGWKICKDPKEWEMRFAPLFTFGRLADLIALRSEFGSTAPLTILGSTSRAAGAFRAIERIASESISRPLRFGPSTPILEQIRLAELPKFWSKVRAQRPTRIPRLDAGGVFGFAEKFKSGNGLLIWLLVCAGVVFGGGWMAGGPSFVGATLFWMVGGVITLIFAWLPAPLILYACDRIPALAQLYRRADRILPEDIETFSDLARLVAGEREGWCYRCGYNLTGVTSGNCPECGREIPRVAMQAIRLEQAIKSEPRP